MLLQVVVWFEDKLILLTLVMLKLVIMILFLIDCLVCGINPRIFNFIILS